VKILFESKEEILKSFRIAVITASVEMAKSLETNVVKNLAGYAGQKLISEMFKS
jgi:hypothetical protein